MESTELQRLDRSRGRPRAFVYRSTTEDGHLHPLRRAGDRCEMGDAVGTPFFADHAAPAVFLQFRVAVKLD